MKTTLLLPAAFPMQRLRLLHGEQVVVRSNTGGNTVKSRRAHETSYLVVLGGSCRSSGGPCETMAADDNDITAPGRTAPLHLCIGFHSVGMPEPVVAIENW
jgi:hypothetical protein